MSTDIGIKLDSGKNDLGLVLGSFSSALIDVGKVGTFGADKYTRNGWQYVDNALDRYESAMLRHYFQYKEGEITDPESGLSHLSHLAWNALAILSLYNRLVKESASNTP